jgi:hypothetical protein
MDAICDEFIFSANVLSADVSCADQLSKVIQLGTMLRNNCTGDEQIVRLMISKKVLLCIVHTFQLFSTARLFESRQEFSADYDENISVMRRKLTVILCRLLSNFAACGEIARNHLFTICEVNSGLSVYDIGPFWGHAVSAAVISKSRNAIAAVISMFYNALQGEEELAMNRCVLFCNSRQLLCQLLLARMENSASEVEAKSDDPASEWFHLLIFHIVKHGLISNLYGTVGPSSVSDKEIIAQGQPADNLDPRPKVTHEQVRIFNFFRHKTNISFYSLMLVW